MRKLPFLILLSCFSAQAQILNAESLRKVTDTSGWSGSATVNFSLARNVTEQISLGSDIHLQYKKNKHLFLVKNQIVFQKVDNEDFFNSGIQHFRYNNRFADRWAWEAFV